MTFSKQLCHYHLFSSCQQCCEIARGIKDCLRSRPNCEGAGYFRRMRIRGSKHILNRAGPASGERARATWGDFFKLLVLADEGNVGRKARVGVCMYGACMLTAHAKDLMICPNEVFEIDILECCAREARKMTDRRTFDEGKLQRNRSQSGQRCHMLAAKNRLAWLSVHGELTGAEGARSAFRDVLNVVMSTAGSTDEISPVHSADL